MWSTLCFFDQHGTIAYGLLSRKEAPAILLTSSPWRIYMIQKKEPLNQKLARMGLFTALGAIFGYVESLLPVFAGIPGVKLGLANLSVLYILMRYSLKEAALVSALRILIVGMLFGNAFGIFYSLCGAALSLLCMNAAKAHTDASTRMISVLGGISHNIGQLFLAMWLVGRTTLLFYTPVLLLFGLLTGLIIGLLTEEVLKRIH